MRKISFVLVALLSLLLFTNCTGGFSASAPATLNFVSVTPNGDNFMSVTTGCGYWNEPCVTVTICQPGSTNLCQTINNVLIDTGSSGLRLFQSSVDLSLPQVTYSGKDLAECINYVDGTAQWGPVKRAAVVLGGKAALNVQVQMVDRDYVGHNSCATYGNLDYAANAGYNGILGVGLNTYDCDSCVGSATGMYKICLNGTCTSTTLPTSYQVSNPVASFTGDNQGVVFDMASVPDAGSDSNAGTVYFGISSRLNNTPAGGAKIFSANSQGYFTVTYGGTPYSESFIDSGSNANYFYDASIASCPSGDFYGFYCPASMAVGKVATLTAADASTPTVTFNVQSASVLNSNNGGNNTAFNNLAGILDISSTGFDLGYPFFLGRKVFVALDSFNGSYPNGYWSFVP